MIEPLDLNLASRPFKNNTLLWTGYSVGLALLVAFAVWNVTSYVEYGRRLAETRADLMGIDEQVADLDRREAQANRRLNQADYDVEMLTSQTEGANGVIEWKAFSWTGLFNHMAEVQPWNVYLVSVRPMFRSRSGGDARQSAQASDEGDRGWGIVVEGFAKDLEALLDLERALFDDRHFDRPEPKRHQPVDSGEIVFEMEFTYYPDGMPGRTENEAPAAAERADGMEPPDTGVVDPDSQPDSEADAVLQTASDTDPASETEPPEVTEERLKAEAEHDPRWVPEAEDDR